MTWLALQPAATSVTKLSVLRGVPVASVIMRLV